MGLSDSIQDSENSLENVAENKTAVTAVTVVYEGVLMSEL